MIINGKEIELDEDGFLVNPEDWDEHVIAYFAQEEEVGELTERHWDVIHYLRNYFDQFGIAPMVRKLCKGTGITLYDMYRLFPTGPAKGACRLAGLPKPTGCI